MVEVKSKHFVRVESIEEANALMANSEFASNYRLSEELSRVFKGVVFVRRQKR